MSFFSTAKYSQPKLAYFLLHSFTEQASLPFFPELSSQTCTLSALSPSHDSLTNSKLLLVSVTLTILDTSAKPNLTVVVILCVTCFITHCPQGSPCCSRYQGFTHCEACMMFCCMYQPYFVQPFIHQWILSMLPPFGYCEWCCSIARFKWGREITCGRFYSGDKAFVSHKTLKCDNETALSLQIPCPFLLNVFLLLCKYAASLVLPLLPLTSYSLATQISNLHSLWSWDVVAFFSHFITVKLFVRASVYNSKQQDILLATDTSASSWEVFLEPTTNIFISGCVTIKMALGHKCKKATSWKWEAGGKEQGSTNRVELHLHRGWWPRNDNRSHLSKERKKNKRPLPLRGHRRKYNQQKRKLSGNPRKVVFTLVTKNETTSITL